MKKILPASLKTLPVRTQGKYIDTEQKRMFLVYGMERYSRDTLARWWQENVGPASPTGLADAYRALKRKQPEEYARIKQLVDKESSE